MPSALEPRGGLGDLALVSDSVTRAPRLTSSSAAASTAARRTRDGDALAPHVELARRTRRHHRSFNVVRLNRAKMMPTITKRVMTFGSLHPISSK